jgi:alpha-1,6-mannosyltransferase
MGRGPELGGGVRAVDRRLHGAGPPLKVLDLTEFFSPQGGGVRTYLSAKARWFAGREDLSHVLVVPGPRDAKRVWLGSTLYEIGGPPAPGSPGYHILTGWGRLRHILERERPDVVELGSIYLAPWSLRRATNRTPIPTVGCFHADLANAVVRTAGRRLSRVLTDGVRAALSKYLRAAYRRCHCVVGPSEAARQAMADAGLPDIRVVPFGVDIDVFHPGQRDDGWKAAVGVGGQQPVALCVGRLGPEKNLGVVLDALPRLHETLGLRLVTIGDGALLRRLTTFAAEHPDMLTVLPFEPDRAALARAYASADLLIAPCAHETFGMAALEAAACGLPVVTASEGAIGARVAGEPWARTFESRHPADLVRAVGEMLRVSDPSIHEQARSAAMGHSWDRTFSGLVEVYGEAVSREP